MQARVAHKQQFQQNRKNRINVKAKAVVVLKRPAGSIPNSCSRDKGVQLVGKPENEVGHVRQAEGLVGKIDQDVGLGSKRLRAVRSAADGQQQQQQPMGKDLEKDEICEEGGLAGLLGEYVSDSENSR